MNKTLVTGATLLAVMGIGLGYYLSQAPQPQAAVRAAQAPQVSVHRAGLQPVSERTEALGTARAQESVNISAAVTERIDKIHFSDGQWVEAGDVLVTLRQAEEQAQLANEQENLIEQERELQRLEDLVKRKLTSQAEVDQRRTLVKRARLRIDELRARLADLTLVAPFTGQVGLRRISAGALAQPDDTITTLDDSRRIKLDFHIPATLLATIKPGQTVTAHAANYPQPFKGTVVAIDSRVNPVDRSVGVLAEFDNPERKLKPGLLMTVELHRQPREALVIPEEALVSRQLQQFVWVVDPQTLQVHQQTVSSGHREPGWVEIRSGLRPDDWVVQEGISVVREGMTVIIKNLADLDQTADQIQPAQPPEPAELMQEQALSPATQTLAEGHR